MQKKKYHELNELGEWHLPNLENLHFATLHYTAIIPVKLEYAQIWPVLFVYACLHTQFSAPRHFFKINSFDMWLCEAHFP